LSDRRWDCGNAQNMPRHDQAHQAAPLFLLFYRPEGRLAE